MALAIALPMALLISVTVVGLLHLIVVVTDVQDPAERRK